MLYQKQKDTIQEFIEYIAKKENPGAYVDNRAWEVRPIIPFDLGLQNWLWPSDKVPIKPKWYIALLGIHSKYLLQVAFRAGGAAGNMVALVSTDQTLYEPFCWRRDKELWVTWKLMEAVPGRRQMPFSILGFVIEPKGMTVVP